MKKDKEKRKHHESTIGKIIYGFLLFLPLLAIGVTCGYAMFNKNAYQSYNLGVNEKQYVNAINVPLNDVYFTFNNDFMYDASTNRKVLTFDNVEYVSGNLTNTYVNEILDSNSVEIWSNGSTNYCRFNNGSNNISGNSGQYTLKFDLVGINSYITSENYNNKIVYTSTFSNNLDNVFYYSVNKLEQSNLFNWAKTSIIYTGMLNFTTALNVTNTFMPMLLTYWLIISVIYFLYDIVLIILVVLHRKIHELQESI